MCVVAGGGSVSVRRKKNMVGVFAIALLLVFTVLAFAGILSFIEWIIADLIVAVIANLILRRIGRQGN
jgi:hypothetical protein